MRNFYFLIFIFFSSFISAQLDREHWFGPMVSRSSSGNTVQKLYLSTNRTTPFPVTIYNNNAVIGTVTISKGNPQKFDIPQGLLITNTQSDLFTPITKGLYVKADFAFFANVRFSVFNHAEIITSKGVSSKGLVFHAVHTPIMKNFGILNFMTSILATEDNTTITVSNYSPSVQFSNGTSGATHPTITFVLNKGQSYIIEGKDDFAANKDAFIGAKIVADKPINVTNGNFNGQYTNSDSGSDILMDQSVPVNQLGNEFAIVKGNGPISTNMEQAMVVATENNTQIFINNEATPAATINTGQYYIVPDTKYQNKGNNHFNLYIKTSKNAYVYQMLAGSSDSNIAPATGGFNFIPALNCYLPKNIDELGLINENYVVSNNNPNGILNIPTKLNLITETGAIVTINGSTPPANTGPFAMTGTSNWVTYGIPNVSGNITVSSSKAITAGITAGSDVIGYGGFFAGFPTQPIIVTNGATCFPGISLTIDPNNYDTYQWYLNGNIIPGATSSSINPILPGQYTASVTMGSCNPLVTNPYTVKKCMVNSTANYNVCTSQNITPALSSPSIPQNIAIPSVVVTVQPTLGTLTINPTTGQITYTPTNPGVAGTDTFTYTFCGNHPTFPECETVQVTINLQQIDVNNATLKACDINGIGVFNLTSASVTTSIGTTTTYYPTLADAQIENATSLITNSTAYSAANGSIVYAVVKNNLGCKKIAQITLNFFPKATVADYSETFCDDNFDGIIPINLSNITSTIVNNFTYFNVRYYTQLSDANLGNNNNLPNNWSFSANATIYIRVDSPDGCPTIIKPIHFIFGNKLPVTTTAANHSVCDDDLDGVKQINLSSYNSSFTTDPQVLFSYHSTLTDAQNNTAPLTNPISVNTNQTFYVRLSKNGACPNVVSLTITVNKPKKSLLLQDVFICSNTKTTLDAGPGFSAYLWSTGATTPSISNVGAGNYWVELTYNGCIYKQNVVISNSDDPVINSIEIKDNNATINVSGGVPPYEFSLDNFNWQTSNIFTGLPRGSYTVYVRDSKKCNTIQKNFIILNLINVITPNYDGYNESISYSDLMTKNELTFIIFDRYGQEIFKGSQSNHFTWNGKTYGGRAVPTATYWYILSWKEPGSKTIYQYTSWLLVKNRNEDTPNR